MFYSRNIWSVTLDEDVHGLKQLLDDGVCVDERSDIGETPLHLAARHGLEVVAKVLLHAGADVKLRDWESGWTPLHRSLYFGYVRISLLLIRAGARIDGGRDQLACVPSIGNRTVRSCSRSECVESANSKLTDRPTVVGQWSDCLSDHDGNTPLDLLSLELRPQLTEARSSERGGDVYSFGKADFFLGYDSFGKADVVTPRRIEALANLQVVRVAASRYHSTAVTLAGNMYTWGHGRGGRLGHGNEDVCMLPTLVEGLTNKRVTEGAASETHTAAVTADGELFTWGRDRFGQLGHGPGASGRLAPKRVEGLRKTIVVAVATGIEHTAVVTATGACYTWGRNNHGQLGYEGTSQTSTPRVVTCLASGNSRGGGGTGRHVLKVSAAARSTVVVTRGLDRGPGLPLVNEVYQWGHGGHMPSRVNFNSVNGVGSPYRWQTHDSRINITEVAAAKYHNLALSTVGQVFTWGFGADNLGLDPRETRTARGPKLVAAMLPENCGANAVHVSASDGHSCVVTDTGDLFTWGTAGEGGAALGHGNRTWQPVAKRVSNLKKAALVAAAPDHTLVLLQASCPALPHGAPLVAMTEGSGKHGSSTRMKRITTVDTEASSDDGEEVDHYAVSLLEEEIRGPCERGDEESSWHDELATRITERAPERSEVLTLKQQCEIVLARVVDLRNASSMLADADALDAPALTKYCAEFVNANLDGILVMGRENDRECLLETCGELACSMLGTSTRKHGRDTSICEAVKDLRAVAVGVQDEEGLDREAMGIALARAELWSNVPSEKVTARAARALRKKLARISEMEGMQERGEDLTPDQIRKVKDKSRMEAELGVLDSQLERVKLVQAARAKRLQAEGKEALPHVPEGGDSSTLNQAFPPEENAPRVAPPASERCANDVLIARPSKTGGNLAPKLDLSLGKSEGNHRLKIKCEACGVTCADSNMYADHLRGKRHRAQMAKLEKQLHDGAKISQLQAEYTRTWETVTTPAPPPPGCRTPSGGIGSLSNLNSVRAESQPKHESCLKNCLGWSENSRNTKSSNAVGNRGGVMRAALEQQHAATQMMVWGRLHEPSAPVPEQSPVAMSLLRSRTSLSSTHPMDQHQPSPQQTEPTPALHSLNDFIVTPGSKKSKRGRSSSRESPGLRGRAWIVEGHTDDADSGEGPKPSKEPIANVGESIRTRTSFSEIIAEEEREKREREEYRDNVWFVSNKPRSTSFETIVEQQRHEEAMAETARALRIQQELEEEMLRLALEMSKNDIRPSSANPKSNRPSAKRGKHRKPLNRESSRHRIQRKDATGITSAGTKSTGNDQLEEYSARSSCARGRKKAANGRAASDGRTEAYPASKNAEVCPTRGDNGNRQSGRRQNGPRCGASMGQPVEQGREEMKLRAP